MFLECERIRGLESVDQSVLISGLLNVKKNMPLIKWRYSLDDSLSKNTEISRLYLIVYSTQLLDCKTNE